MIVHHFRLVNGLGRFLILIALSEDMSAVECESAAVLCVAVTLYVVQMGPVSSEHGCLHACRSTTDMHAQLVFHS